MILFVGDKPSRFNTDPSVAFKGARCEKRLMEWIRQLEPGPYVLYNSHTAIELYGIGFMYRADAHNCVKVVALGNVASKRLMRSRVPHFKLPHPSGRNHQVNDKAFIAAKLEECKTFLQKY